MAVIYYNILFQLLFLSYVFAISFTIATLIPRVPSCPRQLPS